MDWMLLPLRRYAVFQGRARPREYWMFFLFVVLVTILLTVVEALAGIGNGDTVRTIDDYGVSFYSRPDMGWLSGLFSLAMLIPSIAVGVRRLHDTDRSGWWLLIAFVPLVGAIILFVFLVMGGTRGPNRFGPDPVDADPVV